VTITEILKMSNPIEVDNDKMIGNAVKHPHHLLLHPNENTRATENNAWRGYGDK
jgi:hypothetical protein